MGIQVMTVIGARPQFIKAATVSHAFLAAQGVTECIVHTGQHFDDNMSDVFFRELNIPRPSVHLDVHSLSHGAMTGRMIEALEREILARRPDWLLVYGDTNSTLAGALAAAKLGVRVAHVEAGLRSFNRAMPEELNRILTDHASDLLLTPTNAATQRLAIEGIPAERVVQTGDVMQDAAQLFSHIDGALPDAVAQQLANTALPVILCTVHRAETTARADYLRALWQGLSDLSRDHLVVLPLHPRTRACFQETGIDMQSGGPLVIDPVGFVAMVALERRANLILTDSGGVQKEAFFHRTPCVTFREQTEWVELIDSGWNVLCPLRLGAKKLAQTARDRISTTGGDVTPYGAPGASERVVQAIVQASR